MGAWRVSFQIGWQAAKANAMPMAVLWAVAVGLAIGYYRVPGVVAVLEPLRVWQGEHDFAGAFYGRVFFCGLVPGVFMMCVPAIRPRRPLATIVAQSLWCGAWGLYYVCFYRWMSNWFGNDAELATLVKKTVCDMLVWSAFVMVPLNAVFFFWVGHGLSFAQSRAAWPRRFLREVYLPNLVTNMCIWTPVMMAVYAFPLALQIHFGGLAGSFWSLVLLYQNAHAGRHDAESGVR